MKLKLSNLFTAFNCGYPIRNLDDLIEFLRTVDGKLLANITKVREYTPGLGRKAPGLLWLPVVERNDLFTFISLLTNTTD